jgi:CheY-like chemotaxis protein
MQKIELKKLKTVKGISLPYTMNRREEQELQDNLDLFIEKLPQKTFELVKILISTDYYELFGAKISEIAGMLTKIHAETAAQNCEKLAHLIKDEVNKSEVEIRLEKLITELNTLSIDIQIAQYQKTEKTDTIQKAKTIEQKRHDVKIQRNILAVDDDAVILNQLKKIIDGEKYKLIGVISGKRALNYLETHPLPDLIILDIEMPVTDGYEVAQTIVKNGYGIPILFLTSNATRENIVKAMQIGASDFLVKPVNAELILSKLDNYLG